MRSRSSFPAVRAALTVGILGLTLTSCSVAPEVRFEESRAKACNGAANIVSLASEGFTVMRENLADDDFTGFYETGRLVARMGVPFGDAADPEDAEFREALRGLGEALASADGASSDFIPLMTDSVIDDYFAMKTHHSEYVDTAAANVATAAIGLTPFCP